MSATDAYAKDVTATIGNAGGSASVLRGRDIICFAQDWTGDPLSKTHIMRVLARDNRILWVNSIGLRGPTASTADLSRSFKKVAAAISPLREVEPNLFVLNPLSIPAYGQPLVRAFNRRSLAMQVRRALRKLGFRKAINYVFLPSAGLIAGTLGEDQIIYHCVDEYAAFSDIPSQPLAALEDRLLRLADLVIVSSELLYQSKIKANPNTVLVRHGVDYSHFRRALNAETKIPEEIATLPRPVIGFHGLIADWVDLNLVAEVAKQFSRGSIVMVGKTTTSTAALRDLPNVHLLGRKPYAALPAYCKGFDVALNPFRINELTLNSNPLKVREYLAAGLQVVSTAIPEVEILNQCRIGRDSAGFIGEIETALLDPGPNNARSDTIRTQSWEARVDEIRGHLASLEKSN